MFSKACEYGIRSLIFIAMKSREGERVNISAISKEIDSPVAFTAKILQKLVKAAIVISVKGPYGGFEITPSKITQTTLATVVEIIDGSNVYKGCALGLSECNEEKPCPLHSEYARVRGNLKRMLENTTLETLAVGLESGTMHLKI